MQIYLNILHLGYKIINNVNFDRVGIVSDYVYELMKQHHSVRKFKDQPLSSETVEN